MFPILKLLFINDYNGKEHKIIVGGLKCTVKNNSLLYRKGEVASMKASRALQLIDNGYAIEIV